MQNKNQRVQKGIPTEYRRYGETGMQRQDIQERRIAREIHSKETVQMVRQTVQPRILGKIGEELEIIEEKTIAEEKEIKKEEIKKEKSRDRGR